MNDLRLLAAVGSVMNVSKTDEAASVLRFGDIIELDGFKANSPVRYPKGPEFAFMVVE